MNLGIDSPGKSSAFVDIHICLQVSFTPKDSINPFAPGDFAEKRVLKLVEWFSGHCRAIKS